MLASKTPLSTRPSAHPDIFRCRKRPRSLPRVTGQLGLAFAVVAGNVLSAPIDFNRDIRPILSDRCFQCHGPDARNQSSAFRLDTRSQALADLGGVAGIVPGQLDQSEVHHRIRTRDPDDQMPPPDSKLVLSEDDKDLLDRWIESGAPYDIHWAFKPIPERVSVPVVDGPVRTPVDAFILAALPEAGLRPTPETNREQWLRRVTFDLTGLPPTVEEVDAFLDDETENAYPRVVDRLLGSEAYAERMTAEWLDVARYADSYGYQVDRERFVWPWRDWVIRAFRENLPYDQFITWQLAGDLLPNPTRDQVLATTFNRLHPQKLEGGSVPEEFRVEYVSDRLHTFGTAFLGLTLECSRCHDHKYDPVSMKDYYRLTSFFANIDEAGLYSYFTQSVPTPALSLTTPEQDQAIREAAAAVAEAAEAVAGARAAAAPAFEAWLDQRPDTVTWAGLQAHVPFDDRDGGRLPDRARPDHPATTSAANRTVEGVRGDALLLTGDDPVKLPGAGRFSRTQPFTIALWIHPPEPAERTVVFRRSRAWTDAASRGYELLLEDGRPSAALVHFYPGNAIRVRAKEPLPPRTWHHLTVSYDGSGRAAGLILYANGRPIETTIVRDNLTRTIEGGGEPDLALGERFRDVGFRDGSVDDLYVFERALAPLEIAHLHDGHSLRDILRTDREALDAATRADLLEVFLATHPPYGEALAKLKTARDARSKRVDAVPEIMVMRELDQPRPAYVLERGQYAARGEPVSADTPDFLPPFPAGEPPNRLGLARWITASRFPLTARVTVNRYWQMIFGHGLVRTPEDFGSQGRPPSHPELLDWLARDFLDHDWDLHHLMRTLVLSSTYRRASATTPDQREVDPENLLLARGPANRLTAEMIRDQALAAAGLLIRDVGGPPAKPYDVTVSFKPTDHDVGPGLYRRSLYTWWRRTAPAPVMMTLNASKRDVCRVQREVTASPLQALVLLNGPQFVEAARVLGTSCLTPPTDDPESWITKVFRILTSRRPTPEELAILTQLHQDQLTFFSRHPDQADALLQTGSAPIPADIEPPHQAAAAVLANAIMNLDEVVTKR